MYGAYGAATTARGYSTFPRQLAVRLLSEQKHGGCNPDHDPCRPEAPGEVKGLCPVTLFGLFVGIQRNPASPADAEADGHGRQSCDHPLAMQLHDRQATTPRDLKSSSATEMSAEVRTNNGAPQGCVLSPALFTM